MKWLVGIWSIFIWVLTLVPCSDATYDCSDSNLTTTVPHQTHIQDNSSTHDHAKEHKDLCSPFCTCNCCGISFSQIEILDNIISHTVQVFEFSEEKHLIIDDFFISKFYGNIWQPPKITV